MGNMGMAEMEMNEKLSRLHEDSIHDDGCATMFPGGSCDCTQSSIRTGADYPKLKLFDLRTDKQPEGFKVGKFIRRVLIGPERK